MFVPRKLWHCAAWIYVTWNQDYLQNVIIVSLFNKQPISKRDDDYEYCAQWMLAD